MFHIPLFFSNCFSHINMKFRFRVALPFIFMTKLSSEEPVCKKACLLTQLDLSLDPLFGAS